MSQCGKMLTLGILLRECMGVSVLSCLFFKNLILLCISGRLGIHCAVEAGFKVMTIPDSQVQELKLMSRNRRDKDRI